MRKRIIEPKFSTILLQTEVWVSMSSEIFSALIGGVVAVIVTALLTRYVEWNRNIESFRSSLIQKRVETALHIQTGLQDLANQFLDDIESASETQQIVERFVRIRRRVISLAEETTFTNMLIYGYVSGLVYSGLLHDLKFETNGREERLTP